MRLTRVYPIGNGAMTNRGYANCLLTISQLVKDPVGTDSQRVEPA